MFAGFPNQSPLLTMVKLTSFQKTTIAICFNLRQVCPSLPSNVFVLLLIRSYRKVLTGQTRLISS